MKRAAPILFAICLVVFAGIIVLLPFHAFISTWGGTSVGPLLVWKSWKEILLTALIPIIALYLIARPDVANILWSRWVNRLIALYAVLHIIWAVLSPASTDAIIAGLLFNLRFLGLFVLAQMIVASDYKIVHRLKRALAPAILTLTIIVSVGAIVQVTLLPADFLVQFGYDKDSSIAPFVLIDNNPDALRAFSTLRGPNTLGSYLLLPLCIALALVIAERRNILAGLALGLGSAALVMTSSRSAWLGAAAMIAVFILLWLPKKELTTLLKWGTVPLVLLAALGWWLATTVPQLRLAIFHSSPQDASLFEGSSQKHWEATAQGAQDAINNPLGQGVGAAGPASFYDRGGPNLAENYFIQIAQEVGTAGLALFIGISILVAFHLWQQRAGLWARALLASFAGLTVINLFLHGWADDPTAMTWWAIAGLYAFASPKRSIKSKP